MFSFFLAAQVEQKMTDHLFRATNFGDEELAFWALELGAKISKVCQIPSAFILAEPWSYKKIRW